MLKVDIQKRFLSFQLKAAFETHAGATALFGRSGAGKSTILSAIAGLIKPDSGQIELAGQLLFDHGRNIHIKAEKRCLGMVFQDARLFPHMNVSSNLTYGHLAGRGSNKADFDHIIDVLDLGQLLERKPSKLSGGEKQRVAIGRALLASPKLLLLDEPLAALDIERKRVLLRFLKTIRKEFEVPLVFVSHDPHDIYHLADHLVLVEKGEVIQSGSVQNVFASNAMQTFLGEQSESVILKAEVKNYDPEYCLASVRIKGSKADDPSVHLYLDEVSIGTSVRLLLYSRDVALARQKPDNTSLQNCLPVTVTNFSQKGNAHMLVECEFAGQVLFSRITRKSFDELGIGPKHSLFALVKSVALT